MKRVLVANAKGGVGKTLISVTLAAALSNKGQTVTLADADPQASALQWIKRCSKWD
jgi:chromosome partitioning protein